MADTRTTETTPATSPSGPTPERSLWTRTGFVLSVALVVVLIGCLIWLLTTRPAAPHPATGQPASPPVAAAQGCGPAGIPDQVPPGTTPATDWHLVGHMAAPFAHTTGPLLNDEGIGLCYSPTPTGALFAAANFLADTSSAALRQRALEKACVDNDGRTAALAELASTGPGPDSTDVQLAGFRFLSYATTADGIGMASTVDLALTSKGVFVHLPVPLTWTGEDWRIVLPASGQLYANVPVLPDLAGYIPWQGA